MELNLQMTVNNQEKQLPELETGSATLKIAAVSFSKFRKMTKNENTYLIFGHLKSPIKDTTNPFELPSKYNGFSNIFDKQNAELLPAHCPYNCTIKLMKDT